MISSASRISPRYSPTRFFSTRRSTRPSGWWQRSSCPRCSASCSPCCWTAECREPVSSRQFSTCRSVCPPLSSARSGSGSTSPIGACSIRSSRRHPGRRCDMPGLPSPIPRSCQSSSPGHGSRPACRWSSIWPVSRPYRRICSKSARLKVPAHGSVRSSSCCRFSRPRPWSSSRCR